MSKYYDKDAALQVLGCLLKNPSLMDDEGRYFYKQTDFLDKFHQILFGTAYMLYKTGTTNIRLLDIHDYCKRRELLSYYEAQKGDEIVTALIEEADLQNFDHYYDRMKKMSLLRAYNESGVDVSDLYDPDELFDANKIRRQEEYLDSLSLNEISDIIDNKLYEIRSICVDNATDNATHAGKGIFDLLNRLEDNPDFGLPLYGKKFINTVTRGARLGKFYIRSAPTGVGKTRTMIADAAYIAYDTIYVDGEWINNGEKTPVLYISTEMELEEVQTMLLAFVSDVNEDHIKKNNYASEDERLRVFKAAEIINKQPLYIEVIPDFNLKDIENIIKRNIRLNKVQHVFYDYLHSSMKLLEEISRRSSVKGLREDNVLFLLSVKLKEICTQYNVFILTATQLNASYKTDEVPDQNLLRGAKSIADKADMGMIIMNTTDKDREMLDPVVKQIGTVMPNTKMSVYKNRGGRYTNMYLWINANKGSCRYEPVFVTDFEYNPIEIENDIINFKKKGE